MMKSVALMKNTVSVPSRGILFPNGHRVWLRERDIDVSVPSRGILFPNSKEESDNHKEYTNYCFRPLSGYLISKFTAILFTYGIDSRFPSPLGVSYFQIFRQLYFRQGQYCVSVPSRGILFPNKIRR